MSTKKSQNVLSQAVRQLRESLRESQMEFAYRLNVHIVTLARWETSRPPGGLALSSLARVAKKHDQEQLAATFEGALAEALKAKPGPMNFQAPKGFEAAMYAFVDVLQLPGHEEKRKKILKLLEPEIERAKAVFLAVKLVRHETDAISEKRKKQ